MLGKTVDPDTVVLSHEQEFELTKRAKVESRSVTDPILQLGTPVEGLTRQIAMASDPIAIDLDVSSKISFKQGGASLTKIQLAFMSHECLSKGREVGARYYQLISDILFEKPEIREQLKEYPRRTNDVNNALQRYSDAEWARKDKALSIAEELKMVLEQRLDYLSRLRAKLEQIRK